MTTGNTTLLGLALPVQGELDGEWGIVVNDSITSLLDSAVAGTTTLSADSDVTLTTTALAANQARQAILRWTASNGATTRNITAPAQSKPYIVINAGTGSVVLRGVGPTAGITIVSGERCVAAWSGSDFVKVATSATATGTVTAVSVASANGLAGTSSGGATPELTLSTSVTGVLKGNGTAISAATAGTDYLAPPSGTAILKANSGGALANATAGTDYLAPPSGTALLKANSGGALANATAGTDYVAPGTATTFTATQTFQGTSSALAMVLNDAAEVATVSATAATGTINYDITTQSVLYYTSNASANWTVNFRASSGTSLNTALATGQSVTVAFLVTQGATAYYNSAVQVDGTTSGVTTVWLGGAPTAGNASGIDSYRYLIIKTGSATFTVLASNTQFKA
jgi:hypothetical protein